VTDFSPLSWPELLGRLLLAVFLGAVVGLERETVDKPAGLRTNLLVCLGSAVLILSLIQSGIGQASADGLSRGIQGIITGIGFVGGGAILKGDRVHGITSAATVWVSAVTGIVVSLGQWQLGLIVVGLTLFSLRVLKYFE